jgi:hypothetical protein
MRFRRRIPTIARSAKTDGGSKGRDARLLKKFLFCLSRMDSRDTKLLMLLARGTASQRIRRQSIEDRNGLAQVTAYPIHFSTDVPYSEPHKSINFGNDHSCARVP